MSAPEPKPFLPTAIRVVGTINILWGIAAAFTGNWPMVAIQAVAAVVLMTLSFFVSVRPQPELGTVRPVRLAPEREELPHAMPSRRATGPDTPSPSASGLLDWACTADLSKSTPEQVREILAQGASIHDRDEDDWSAFEHAAMADAPPEVLRALALAGAEVSGHPGLLELVIEQEGAADTVRTLIELGVDPNAEPADYHSLLELAISSQVDDDIILALMDGGASWQAATVESCSLASLAIENGCGLEVVVRLSPPGMDQDGLDHALMMVVSEVEDEDAGPMVAHLVHAGADPFSYDATLHDQSPIAQSVENGDIHSLERMADVLPAPDRHRLRGWVEALDPDLAGALQPRLELADALEAAWATGYAKPAFNQHGHEDRCSLMFPATLGTSTDRCDCAAKSGRQSGTDGGGEAIARPRPPTVQADGLARLLDQASTLSEIQHLLIAGADPLAPPHGSTHATVLDARAASADPFALAMLIEPLPAGSCASLQANWPRARAFAVDFELGLRRSLRNRYLETA